MYQNIKEELILNNAKHIDIKWIPGHTDNTYNEKADELAKLATNLNPKIPGNRALFNLPDRHFRPRPLTE